MPRSLLPPDYHFHTRFSPDSGELLEEHVKKAVENGLQGLCVTDHAEFDPYLGGRWTLDFPASMAEFRRVRALFPEVDLRYGYELGIPDSEAALEDYRRIVSDVGVDFAIASVHFYRGKGIFDPDWYEGRTYPEACRAYLEAVCERVRCLREEEYCIVGHLDCPGKANPLYTGQADNRVRYAYMADEFDTLARYLIERGKSVEYNTSSWRKIGEAEPPGLDWLSRLHELGAEFITFGSDAHRQGHTGYRFEKAKEIALAAGFRYYAVYRGMKAEIKPIES